MGIPSTIEGTIDDFTGARQCHISTRRNGLIGGTGILDFAANVMRGQQMELEAWRNKFPHYEFQIGHGKVELKENK